MQIKSIHIISFGGIRNREIRFDEGVNVISGRNESGKSSAAMFIKFIFYGLSGRISKNKQTEKQKYINRTTSQAAGALICATDDGTEYRIERLLTLSDGASPRERVRITNLTTGESTIGQNPGEIFFGVPEEVFVSTCFVSQSAQMKPEVTGLTGSSPGGAVENLLTSADESVDIGGAVKLLDNRRRELLHKNGSGGEIAALKEKRTALEAEMNASAGRSAEILQADLSLEDIKRKIAELEAADEKWDGIFSALEKINVKRKIDAAEQAKSGIEKLNRQLAELDNSPLGEGFVEALQDCERDIRAYDEECLIYDERMPELEAAGEPEELPDEAEIITEVHHRDSRAKIQFGVAAAFLISGVIGLAAALLLFYFNTQSYMIPLVMAAALAVMGVIFLIQHFRSKSALNAILDEWNADSPAEIDTAAAERIRMMERGRSVIREKERLEASLAAAKLRFDAADDRIRTLAADAGVEDDGELYDVLSALHGIADEITEKRSGMLSALEKLTGRLDTLTEQLDGVDQPQADLEASVVLNTPYGKIAAALDKQSLPAALRERDFTENALKTAIKRRSNLEETLASLGRPDHAPAEYATLISAVDERIDELSLRADACDAARAALISAGENMRSGVVPKLASRASALIENATGGAHDRLTLDDGFRAGLGSGSDVMPAEFLSRGTSDLAYLALRIALAEEVFREESPFLVLDESFAHFDRERTLNMFRLLDGGQYLVFTCREDEVRAANELGYTVAEL